ncbi:MAG: gliding motility protein GldN [Sphingobacteriales bacterium]|nr:MAG: gliding motility protein GldN [Sphingobacteriales bacterium]
MNIRKTYRIVASVALAFASSVAFAQTNQIVDQTQTQFTPAEAVNDDWQPSLVTDGTYDRIPHIVNTSQWQAVRENDIMWKKRVWREIDTREKQNMAFRYPGDEQTGGGYFIEIILDAVKKGKIKAYSNMDDRFTSALSKEQILEMLMGTLDTIMIDDIMTGEKIMKVTRREFDPNVVTKYRIKEDWIFDRNLGRMTTRIIGIAPIKDIYNEDGSFRASQAVFWLYYPHIREMLAQYEVFNPENDVARMTWDDYFEGRYFSSKIIKTSNPFDASFSQRGMTNLEALYEGEKVKEMLFNKEHDMWVY